MTKKFSLKEMKELYKTKETIKEKPLEELISLVTGVSTIEKLKKLSTIRGMRNINVYEPIRSNQIKSIAICLVIVDELRHEDIWREWIGQGHGSCPYRAELYIHAKFPEKIQSEWVKARTLPHSFRPEWNSPEVVRAMLAVLQKGLEDQSNGRFIFGTESCLPVCSLQEAGDELFAYDVSWADAYSMPKSTYEEQQCFLAVNPLVIPKEHVWKALPGWIMITRRHAEDIVTLPRFDSDRSDLVSAWNTVHAPEEVYFSTLLSILGYLRDSTLPHTILRNTIENPFEFSTQDEVWRRRVTYAEWVRKEDANPITYPRLTLQMMTHFRQTGALFARKFPSNVVTVNQWNHLLTQVTPLATLTGRASQRLLNPTDTVGPQPVTQEPIQSPVNSEEIHVLESALSTENEIKNQSQDPKADSFSLQNEPPCIYGSEIESEENARGQVRPLDPSASDEGPAKQKPRLQ